MSSTHKEKVWALSKEQVDYGPSPSPQYECRNCRYMFPKTAVGTCKLVRGSIKVGYSCSKFKP